MYIPDYIFVVHLREKFDFSRDLVHYLAVGFCLDPLEGIDTSVKNVPDLKEKNIQLYKVSERKGCPQGDEREKGRGCVFTIKLCEMYYIHNGNNIQTV